LGSRSTTVVHITKEGFMPSYIRVPTGAKITWVSKDTISHWPASDFHPTHGRYPSKEKGCIGSALDACRGLEEDEEYFFVFNKTGTWGMHDHLSPGTAMIVEVVDNILFSKISAAAGRFLRGSKAAAPPRPEDFILLEYPVQLEIIKQLSRENARKAYEYFKSAYILDDGQQVFVVDTEWIERQHVFAHVIGNQAYRQYGIAAFLKKKTTSILALHLP